MLPTAAYCSRKTPDSDHVSRVPPEYRTLPSRTGVQEFMDLARPSSDSRPPGLTPTVLVLLILLLLGGLP